MRLMFTPISPPSPVNIGNPAEFTIAALANMVLSEARSRNLAVRKTVSLPLPRDDPKVRKPSIELATSLLDWQPRVQIAEGLRMTFDYLMEALDVAAKSIV